MKEAEEEFPEMDEVTCEECGENFSAHELEAEAWYGPFFCEKCREDLKTWDDTYEFLNIWLNKNK